MAGAFINDRAGKARRGAAVTFDETINETNAIASNASGWVIVRWADGGQSEVYLQAGNDRAWGVVEFVSGASNSPALLATDLLALY